jgi:hypothetical protein
LDERFHKTSPLKGIIAMKICSFFKSPFCPTPQRGSVAIEYLVVSGFTLILSIAAVTWIGTVMREKMTKIAGKIHAAPAEMELDMGLEGGP